jgi:hypothetical protein
MTNPDFAELKEKLTIQEVDNYEKFNHPCKGTCSGWQQGFDKALHRDKAIITELLEIIQSQSEALEFYADPFTYSENEYGEKKIDYYRTYEKGEYCLSETNTRLLKLREGENE